MLSFGVIQKEAFRLEPGLNFTECSLFRVSVSRSFRLPLTTNIQEGGIISIEYSGGWRGRRR